MEAHEGRNRFVASSHEVDDQAVVDWLARWPDRAEGLGVLTEYYRAWTEAIEASNLPKELVRPPYELPEPPLAAAPTSAGAAVTWAELGAKPSGNESAEPLDAEASLQMLEEWLARWPSKKWPLTHYLGISRRGSLKPGGSLLIFPPLRKLLMSLHCTET